MKLTRPSRHRYGETIIALIDVVFFLLVFAMLAGRMDATSPFEMTPPVATTGSDLQTGGVTLSVSSSGKLAVDGEIINRTDLVRTVTERIAAMGSSARIRINADGATALRHVLPIVGALEAADAEAIVFVVTPGPV